MSDDTKCELCGADLYITASFSMPLEYVAHTPMDVKVVPQQAVSSSWSVDCENGHTLDTSEGWNDYAEPFRLPLRSGSLAGATDLGEVQEGAKKS